MNARYYDGRIAKARVGTLRLMGDVAVLRDEEGRDTRFQPADMAVYEHPHADRPGVFHFSSGEPGARLEVGDPELFGRIAALLPRRRARKPLSVSFSGLTFWLAVSVLLGLAIYWFAPSMSQIASRLMTPSMEKALGEYAWDVTYADTPRCVEPKGEAALRSLALRLASAARVPTPDVRVMDDRELNAFALPGGRIVMLRGLIAKAQSAEEVAGVLAHEMGHVAKRHPVQGVIRMLGMQTLMVVGFGGSGGHEVASKLGTLLQLKYSRDAEREADALALRTLNLARIDSGGLVRFFERLEREEPHVKLLDFLSTHPASEDRARAVRGSGGHMPALSAEEWAALKGICAQTRKDQ